MSLEIGTIGEGSVVKIKLGFLISCLGVIVGIVSIFLLMRSDVLSAITRVEYLEKQRTIDNNSFNELKFNVKTIDDNLFYFRKQYEEDQNKYIRERPK